MGIKITGLFEPSAGAGAFALVNADDIQFDAGPEVTLDVNGDFTQPSSFHFTLDTYGDAASDNVRNITRDANAPALFIFRPASDARTIVVEHDATGGNVSCAGGADITLDDLEDFCLMLYDSVAARWYAMSAVGGGGGGAPTDADYLVGTANAGLSAEIVVGTSPGGELGGTWASPTVDSVHSGSAHHAESHTLASHSAKAHSDLSGIGSGDHHAQTHGDADHSETYLKAAERQVEIVMPLSKALPGATNNATLDDDYLYKKPYGNVGRRINKWYVRFESALAASATFELRKNGTAITGASITVAASARDAAIDAFTEATLADGDYLEVWQTAGNAENIGGRAYIYGDEDVVAAVS